MYSDPWPGNILHHGFVFSLLGLDLTILLHWVHDRKKEKTEKMVCEFFCSCLGKIDPFQWGKTHMNPCWDRKAAKKKDKATKDLQQYCGDIFYLFPLLWKEKPVKDHMVWSQGTVSVVLWAGSWADKLTQCRSTLTSPMRSLHQGKAHFSFLAQLPGKATLEFSVWDAAVPKEVALSHLLLSTLCAAHLFPHLCECCHSVQQTG